MPSRRQRVVTEAAWAAYAVVPTVLFGGTVGDLLLGLHVVERSSGRPVGWSRAAARWAVAAVPRVVLGGFARAAVKRRVDALTSGKEARVAELARLAEELGSDEQALERAVEELLVGAYPRPRAAVPLLVMGGWLAIMAAQVRDPWHRALRDRVAGTMVVSCPAGRSAPP